MKKKVTLKKLTLASETLRALDNDHLERVGGGSGGSGCTAIQSCGSCTTACSNCTL
jgi:hypothetical protein